MSRENVKLVYRWFEEVWNKGRAEAIGEMFAEDGVAHGLAGEGAQLRGPSGFLPFFENFRSTFPDIRVTIEDTVAEGDKVAARWTAGMTHTGDGLGMAATGRPAQVTGMSIVRVRDGKIAEAWNNWDVQGLLQQLGMSAAAPEAVQSKKG